MSLSVDVLIRGAYRDVYDVYVYPSEHNAVIYCENLSYLDYVAFKHGIEIASKLLNWSISFRVFVSAGFETGAFLSPSLKIKVESSDGFSIASNVITSVVQKLRLKNECVLDGELNILLGEYRRLYEMDGQTLGDYDSMILSDVDFKYT